MTHQHNNYTSRRWPDIRPKRVKAFSFIRAYSWFINMFVYLTLCTFHIILKSQTAVFSTEPYQQQLNILQFFIAIFRLFSNLQLGPAHGSFTSDIPTSSVSIFNFLQQSNTSYFLIITIIILHTDHKLLSS